MQWLEVQCILIIEHRSCSKSGKLRYACPYRENKKHKTHIKKLGSAFHRQQIDNGSIKDSLVVFWGFFS